ncbi:tripartite tricarboxylate transporter TctB family protein [Paracoccus sp. (in: a-proteobacteria)]|uniref:tripartite tricarboxylate transporter TctB family protein n=1 Tax=Paracoccus sp. TaxID=267 RepID=UPI003A8ACAB5
MRTTDLIFSALYLAALIVAFSQMSSLSEIAAATHTSAKLYPQLVLGIGILVGVIETFRTLATPQPEGAPDLRAVWADAFRRRRMVLLALFIVYLFTIQPAGFLIATFVFCFATTAILAPVRDLRLFLTAAVVALATVGLIHVLLVIYLEAFLP